MAPIDTLPVSPAKHNERVLKGEQPMNSEKMALVASQKSPAMYRLQNLKAYHRLGSAARQLVKAVVVEGIPVDRAIADQPNGARVWNSQTVIDCLAAYGYQPPAKPLPAVAAPYAPAEHPPVPELPCEDCGNVGRWDSRNGSRLVCHSCLCEAFGIHRPGSIPWTAPDPAQPSQPQHRAPAAMDLAVQPPPPNDLAALRGVIGGQAECDFRTSQEFWLEQDRADQYHQGQDRQERDRVESEFHRARADYLSRGGRL
jgi:hypothetical protein